MPESAATGQEGSMTGGNAMFGAGKQPLGTA